MCGTPAGAAHPEVMSEQQMVGGSQRSGWPVRKDPTVTEHTPSMDRVRELFCDGLLLHEGMESERPARREAFDRALDTEIAKRQSDVADRLDQALMRLAQGGHYADLVEDAANIVTELRR